MNVSRIQLPDLEKEQRLHEIRREAEQRGAVTAEGIRPSGSPFPMASPETGYYGIPLLKQPSWTWEIPLYFFVGGAAGAFKGRAGEASRGAVERTGTARTFR